MTHKQIEAFGITKTPDGKLEVSSRAVQKFIRYTPEGVDLQLKRLDKSGALFVGHGKHKSESMFVPVDMLSEDEKTFGIEQKILETSHNVREFVITTLAV